MMFYSNVGDLPGGRRAQNRKRLLFISHPLKLSAKVYTMNQEELQKRLDFAQGERKFSDPRWT